MCDEVLASKPTDESTLGAMMHVLRGLGRRECRASHLLACDDVYAPPLDTDMVAMYEDAYKQQPSNEELGSQAFMANVRIGNWKSAQQVCIS